MWNRRPLLCLFAITVAVSLPARGRRTTEPAALSAFRTRLQHASAADTFSGTALVAKQGAPMFEAAFNRADRERGIPNLDPPSRARWRTSSPCGCRRTSGYLSPARQRR